MQPQELVLILLNENALWEYDGKFHVLGGPGSGHHGHKGRPGQRGGSAPGGAASLGNILEERIARNNKEVQPWDIGHGTSAGWIAPSGKIYAVPWERHRGVAIEAVLPLKLPREDQIVTLEREGFSRVATQYGATFVNVDLDWTPRAVFKTLKDIISVNDPNQVVFEIMRSREWVSHGFGADNLYKELKAQGSTLLHESLLLGGPGSGHYGHKGRKGSRGGSLPKGGALSAPIEAALKKCQTEGEKIKGEYGIILDAEGNTILEQIGEAGAVIYYGKLPPEAAVTLHNHPVEGTFSGGDVIWLVNHPQLQSELVVDPTGTVYRLDRTPQTPTAKELYPDKMSPELYLHDDIQKMFDAVVVGEQKAYFADKIPEMRSFPELKEEFVQQVASRYHLTYTKEHKLSEPALALMDNPLREVLSESPTISSFLLRLVEEDYHFRTDGEKVVILKE